MFTEEKGSGGGTNQGTFPSTTTKVQQEELTSQETIIYQWAQWFPNAPHQREMPIQLCSGSAAQLFGISHTAVQDLHRASCIKGRDEVTSTGKQLETRVGKAQGKVKLKKMVADTSSIDDLEVVVARAPTSGTCPISKCEGTIKRISQR